MKKSSLKSELLYQIEILEAKQKQDLFALKYQLEDTYENLKPIHLIKDFFEDTFLKPSSLKNSFFKSLISGAGSLLLKKTVVGKTNSLWGTIFGNIFQFISYKVLNKYINK